MFGTIDEPLVSIVMPVYNAEDYLEESLCTVVSQSYRNLEIICVDDGSRDDSLLLIKKMMQEDQRISVVTQENQGAGAARNLGLKEANGEYILFFDADDILKKDMVQTMLC